MNFKIIALSIALCASNTLFCPAENHKPQQSTKQEANVQAPPSDWLSQPMNRTTLFIIAGCAATVLIVSYVVSKFQDNSDPKDFPF